MTISKKLIVGLTLVVIVTIGISSLIYTIYRLRDHKEFLSDYSPEIKHIEKAQGETITLTETRDGNRRWVLKMKEIKYGKDSKTAKLIDIKGIVYGDSKEVLFIFKAPDGDFFKDSNRIILKSGATIISPSSDIAIEANSMDWSSDGKMIKAMGGVRMTKKNFGTSRAQEALFAMDFSQIEFNGNVNSSIDSHTNVGEQN